MSLTNEEKGIIAEALNVYGQMIARQVPQEQLAQISELLNGIMQKLENIGSVQPGSNKPNGITDEWFENVCQSCPSLTPTGCKEKVTEKFPGKCDPILRYEQQKLS